MTKTIVVTGATGQVGGAVVEALVGNNMQVRAATREPVDYRGDRQVTPIRFDYHAPETFAPALAGADGLFLIALPLDFAAPYALAPIIDQAKAAGVAQIVLNSALGVELNEEAPLRKVERYLMVSGVPYTIVRPNFFMDNFVTGSLAPMITEKEGIFLPAGGARTSFIATRDIAAVVAAAFTEGLRGQEFNLTGPEALDHYQVAAAISKVSGRPITYQPLNEGDFLAMMQKRGMPGEAARYLAMLYGIVRAGYMERLTGDVLRVTGRAPLRFVDYAEEHAAAWRKPEEVPLAYAAQTLVGQGGIHLSR